MRANDLRCVNEECHGGDYRIAISRRDQLWSLRRSCKEKQKKRSGRNESGSAQMNAEMMDWLVRHRQTSYPLPHEDTRTNGHDALKHETRSIEARKHGPENGWRSGGSITRASFYDMEPQKAPETWRRGGDRANEGGDDKSCAWTSRSSLAVHGAGVMATGNEDAAARIRRGMGGLQSCMFFMLFVKVL